MRPCAEHFDDVMRHTPIQVMAWEPHGQIVPTLPQEKRQQELTKHTQ